MSYLDYEPDEDFYRYDSLDYDYDKSEPDSYYLEAIEKIKTLFENEKDEVYYFRQLQIKFEKDFFSLGYI